MMQCTFTSLPIEAVFHFLFILLFCGLGSIPRPSDVMDPEYL